MSDIPNILVLCTGNSCRERIGQLRGHWRDTLLLERRSTAVGTTDTVPAS